MQVQLVPMRAEVAVELQVLRVARQPEEPAVLQAAGARNPTASASR